MADNTNAKRQRAYIERLKARAAGQVTPENILALLARLKPEDIPERDRIRFNQQLMQHVVAAYQDAGETLVAQEISLGVAGHQE